MISNDLPLTLSQKADRMVRRIAQNSPQLEESVTSFFRHANETKTHGPALTAYFSALGRLNKETGKDITEKVLRTIEKKYETNKTLKSELDNFIQTLNTVYKKTLSDRIALLAEGAIEEGKVKPVSSFRRFFVLIDRLIYQLYKKESR